MRAEYPWLAYEVLPCGDLEIEIDNGVDPPTTDTITLGTSGAAAQSYSIASGAAGTTAALLATALETHSYWGGSPPTLVATYDQNLTGPAPAWRISTATAGVDVTITVVSGDAAPLACLGLVAGDFDDLVTLTGSWDATRRWRGLWSPGDETARAEPEYIDLGSGSRNPYDPSSYDRYRLGRQLVWGLDWSMVEAADISRELVAQDSGLQSLGGRTTDDTQGMLDDLLGAAGSGRIIRLVLSGSDTRDCVMVDEGEYRRSRYTRPETVGGRRYSVSLGLVEASTYTGVVT